MKSRLTVSIVTYNTDLNELTSCLRSLESPVVDKIYIVDNSKQSYIAEFCRGVEKVVYIGSENVGYGAGHNKAIRQTISQADYHLVLNSDVRFNPMILQSLVEYMDENLDVGQIQPKITYPNGELQYTVRMLPSPKDLIFRRFLPKRLVEKNDYRYLLKFANHNEEMNVPYHQGSFMMFRTEALRKIGLFDERFFMYPEDIDLTRRIHRDYLTVYFPHTTVVHHHAKASYHSLKMLWIHAVNMCRYFNKWGWWCDKEREEMNRVVRLEVKG